MQRLGAVGPHVREVEPLHQIELHRQLDAAARRRRVAVDVVAAIGRVDRLLPLGPIGSEIGGGHHAVVLLEEAVEFLGDVALVEAIEGRVERLCARLLLFECRLLGVDRLAKRRREIGVPN